MVPNGYVSGNFEFHPTKGLCWRHRLHEKNNKWCTNWLHAGLAGGHGHKIFGFTIMNATRNIWSSASKTKQATTNSTGPLRTTQIEEYVTTLKPLMISSIYGRKSQPVTAMTMKYTKSSMPSTPEESSFRFRNIFYILYFIAGTVRLTWTTFP